MSIASEMESKHDEEMEFMRRIYRHYRLAELFSYGDYEFNYFLESRRVLIPMIKEIMENEIANHLNVMKRYYPNEFEYDEDDYEEYLDNKHQSLPLYVRYYYLKRRNGWSEEKFIDFLQQKTLENLEERQARESIKTLYIPLLSSFIPDIVSKFGGRFELYKLEDFISKAISELCYDAKSEEEMEQARNMKRQWIRFFEKVWRASKTEKMRNFFIVFLGENSNIGRRIIMDSEIVGELNSEILTVWREINRV